MGSEELLNAAFARSVRGRIVLGRGDVETATADAREILAYAESTDNHECFSHGLALQALALRAAGRDEDALATCTTYLDRWALHPQSQPLRRSGGHRSDSRDGRAALGGRAGRGSPAG